VSDLPERISVREVGPRDGLQNEDPVPTRAKIELIDRLSATGVQRIEAVSFVRPEAIPQMADADEVWLGIERAPSVRYSALVPNLRGARRALDRGLAEIEAVVSASDTHNRKNVNRSTEESLDDIAVVIDEAHQRAALGWSRIATFGCDILKCFVDGKLDLQRPAGPNDSSGQRRGFCGVRRNTANQCNDEGNPNGPTHAQQ